MGNLTKRVLTAVIGVPLLLFIFYRGGIAFLVLILAIILAGQVELHKLLKEKGVSYQSVLAFLSGVAMGMAAFFGYIPLLAIFTIVTALAFILRLGKGDLSGSISEIGATLFAIVYLGWFLSHCILLRNIDQTLALKTYAETVQGLGDAGFFYVVLVVACTFLNDTGAYFVGRWKGRRKLTPVLSPGKTVEGTVGGLVLSIITGEVINLIFKSPLEFYWAFFFGFIVGVLAVFGDLVESMLKRSVGIKDSGGILPGHGGVLDRFDSLILVFPLSYYLVLLYYWLNGVLLI
jgi:phosphatidate cytidylyltransferase